jgi:hypothetical protein
MKRLSITLLLLSGLVIGMKESKAQVALGIRAGMPVGLSIKVKPMEPRALEFIVGTYGFGNVNVTGLYEFQKQVGNVNGLMFYAGPGLHINVQDDIRDYRYYRYNNGRYDARYGTATYISAGVDAIFGIEYKIPDFPMSFGADLKPSLDIGNRHTGLFMDGALNVRFHIN